MSFKWINKATEYINFNEEDREMKPRGKAENEATTKSQRVTTHRKAKSSNKLEDLDHQDADHDDKKRVKSDGENNDHGGSPTTKNHDVKRSCSSNGASRHRQDNYTNMNASSNVKEDKRGNDGDTMKIAYDVEKANNEDPNKEGVYHGDGATTYDASGFAKRKRKGASLEGAEATPSNVFKAVEEAAKIATASDDAQATPNADVVHAQYVERRKQTLDNYGDWENAVASDGEATPRDACHAPGPPVPKKRRMAITDDQDATGDSASQANAGPCVKRKKVDENELSSPAASAKSPRPHKKACTSSA